MLSFFGPWVKPIFHQGPRRFASSIRSGRVCLRPAYCIWFRKDDAGRLGGLADIFLLLLKFDDWRYLLSKLTCTPLDPGAGTILAGGRIWSRIALIQVRSGTQIDIFQALATSPYVDAVRTLVDEKRE